MLTANLGCCIGGMEGDRSSFVGRIENLEDRGVEASEARLTVRTDGDAFSLGFLPEGSELGNGKEKRRGRRFW